MSSQHRRAHTERQKAPSRPRRAPRGDNGSLCKFASWEQSPPYRTSPRREPSAPREAASPRRLQPAPAALAFHSQPRQRMASACRGRGGAGRERERGPGPGAGSRGREPGAGRPSSGRGGARRPGAESGQGSPRRGGGYANEASRLRARPRPPTPAWLRPGQIPALAGLAPTPSRETQNFRCAFSQPVAQGPRRRLFQLHGSFPGGVTHPNFLLLSDRPDLQLRSPQPAGPEDQQGLWKLQRPGGARKRTWRITLRPRLASFEKSRSLIKHSAVALPATVGAGDCCQRASFLGQ